jgi:hypothetical protein
VRSGGAADQWRCVRRRHSVGARPAPCNVPGRGAHTDGHARVAQLRGRG